MSWKLAENVGDPLARLIVTTLSSGGSHPVILRCSSRPEDRAWPGRVTSFLRLDFPREARYVQKTVTFHIDFAPEIVEESRYEMQTLYSLERLELANKALGRK